MIGFCGSAGAVVAGAGGGGGVCRAAACATPIATVAIKTASSLKRAMRLSPPVSEVDLQPQLHVARGARRRAGLAERRVVDADRHARVDEAVRADQIAGMIEGVQEQRLHVDPQRRTYLE